MDGKQAFSSHAEGATYPRKCFPWRDHSIRILTRNPPPVRNLIVIIALLAALAAFRFPGASKPGAYRQGVETIPSPGASWSIPGYSFCGFWSLRPENWELWR